MTTAAAAAYEYATACVSRDLEDLYHEAYRSFGWRVESHEPPRAARVAARSVPSAGDVVLRLRRHRDLPHRTRIAELQREAESALADIDQFERFTTSSANAVSRVLALVGAALLAASAFSFPVGSSALVAALGGLGLLAWLGGLVANTAIRRRWASEVGPAIDRRYETVHRAIKQSLPLLA